MGLTTDKWLPLALFAPYRSFMQCIDKIPSIAILPVYGRSGASQAHTANQRSLSRNYGEGSNQIPLCSFQTWDVNSIDYRICIKCISKHPHFKCDLFTPISNRGIIAPWQYNMLTQGAEGAICQPPSFSKGADANGYIWWPFHIRNYALRRYNSCYQHHTQKIAPSLW